MRYVQMECARENFGCAMPDRMLAEENFRMRDAPDRMLKEGEFSDARCPDRMLAEKNFRMRGDVWV